jgi:uncharacterized membrane-anchored protein
MSWKDSSSTAKVLIVFSVVFLVSLGMCGLTAFANVGDMGAGVIELLLMIVCVVGIVVTLVVSFVHNMIDGRGGRPQTLFGEDDESKKGRRDGES